MSPLSLAPPASDGPDVLCIGAHCDDIEIGCGGTVLALQRQFPRCRIHWLILTSDAARRGEAEASARRFVGDRARGEVSICDLPDGLLPAHFARVKTCFNDMRGRVAPDVVFTHHGADRHQDHALLAEVTWQTFRDHTIWEYEIPKYDADLATPNMYVPLTESVAAQKVDTIMRSFASQRDKFWFTPENLMAVMRLRGLECRSPSGLAEGFHCRKLVLGLDDDRTAPPPSRTAH